MVIDPNGNAVSSAGDLESVRFELLCWPVDEEMSPYRVGSSPFLVDGERVIEPLRTSPWISAELGRNWWLDLPLWERPWQPLPSSPARAQFVRYRPGRYQVVAMHPRWGSAIGAWLDTREGETVRATIDYREPFGQHEGALLAGRIVDDEGVPVAGAVVQAFEARDSHRSVPLYATVTAADGTYCVPIPGDVALRFHGPQHRAVVRSFAGTSREDGTIALDVTLPRSPFVQGHVAVNNGQPLPAGTSLFRPLSLQPAVSFDLSTGAFRIDRIGEGHQRELVRVATAWTYGPSLFRVESLAVGQIDARIVLPSPTRFSGQVLLPNGKPAATAAIQFLPDQRWPETRSVPHAPIAVDPTTGRFDLQPVMPFVGEVVVSVPGRPNLVERIDLQEGAHHEREFGLPCGGD